MARTLLEPVLWAMGPGVGPMQVAEVVTLTGAHWLARGVGGFLVVLVVGAGVRRWRPGLVDRATEAATARPVAALGYGLAAHAVLALAAVYLITQLATVGGLGPAAGPIGAAVGGGFLALAAGLGFTVVGRVVAEVGGLGSRLDGVVVGAVLAGVAASLDPLVGAVGWSVLVSTGIGGSVRTWLHASAGPDG